MRASPAVLGVFLALVAGTVGAAPPGVTSGVYDGALLIGVDRASGLVSGYFRSTTGGGQFSCIFYLSGRLHGAKASIVSYFPEASAGERIPGELVAADEKNLRIRLASEHGGCWNVTHFADADQPATFELGAGFPWVAVAVVKAKRAYVFDGPDPAARRKGYVVRGDGVGIRAWRGTFAQVDYVGGDDGRTTSGWMSRTDLY